MKRWLLVGATPLYMWALLQAGHTGFALGLRQHVRVTAQIPHTTSFGADPAIPALRRLDSEAVLVAAAGDAARVPSPSPSQSARVKVTARPTPSPSPSPSTKSHGHGGAGATPAPTQSPGHGKPSPSPKVKPGG